MHIESEQLGPLEISEDSVVSFPHGLPGFPQAHQFCLVAVKPGSRFHLLQCTHKANLAFVVADPLQIDPHYPLDVVQEMASQIGLEKDEPLAVVTIVTVPAPPKTPTVNMLAPIAMGIRSRLGIQVVLHDTDYQVRHAL